MIKHVFEWLNDNHNNYYNNDFIILFYCIEYAISP